MIDKIPSRVYQGISFSKGGFPDFELLASCFIEQGLFINNKGESPVIKSLPDYIAMIKMNIESGAILSIVETELSSDIRAFGKVAQISSEYELRFEGARSSQIRYGINLFQLIHRDNCWLVSSMCWDDRSDRSLLSKSL